MAKNRELGAVPLIVYLLIWWGLVVALGVFATSNSAPGEPQLAWADAEPATTTKLAVEIVTDAPDANGDKVTYSYSWTRNGEPVEGKEGQTISSKETTKDDVWEVTVVPNDGTFESWGCNLPWRECAGNVSTKLAVTIVNSPPRARIGFDNPDAPEGERNIVDWDGKSKIALALSCFDPDVIDQERIKRAEDLANGVEPEAKPAEGEEVEEVEEVDPCTYTVGWFDADAEADPDAEEGAEPVPEFTDVVLTRNELRNHDRWRVVVVANDGIEDGEVVEERIAKLE